MTLQLALSPIGLLAVLMLISCSEPNEPVTKPVDLVIQPSDYEAFSQFFSKQRLDAYSVQSEELGYKSHIMLFADNDIHSDWGFRILKICNDARIQHIAITDS